jgi:SHS2 domain-containing protein
MTEKFKFIDDLTSDVMFEASGGSLEELFTSAAEAMFSVICDIKRIEPKDKKRVIVEADSPEKLVVAWLQKLIGLVDTEEMFFSVFDVRSVKEINNHDSGKKVWQLNADIYGEPIKPERGGTVVKAVTNYGFKFEKGSKGYKVTVSLDI